MACDELESFEEWYLKMLDEAEELYLRLFNLPRKYPERRAVIQKMGLLRKILKKKGLIIVREETFNNLVKLARERKPYAPHMLYTSLSTTTISSKLLYHLLKDPKPFVETCKLFEKESQDTYVKLVKLLASVSSLLWLALSAFPNYCNIPSISLKKHGIEDLGYGKYLKLFNVKNKFNIENVENLMKEIFVCEAYMFKEKGFVPKDGSVFIDLGAALGETSLWYSLYAQNFTSLAIEASEEALKVLKWNLNLASDYLKSKNAEVIPIKKLVKGGKDLKEVLARAPREHSEVFLKMDIEGHEREVLKGISDFLREDKPTLGIASYHRWDDLIEIPRLIVSSNDAYKLHLKPKVVLLSPPYGFTFNVFAR